MCSFWPEHMSDDLSLERMAFFRARAYGLELPAVLEEALSPKHQAAYHAALVIRAFLRKVCSRMRLLHQIQGKHAHQLDLVVNNPLEQWLRISPTTSKKELLRICLETYHTDPSDWYVYSVEPKQTPSFWICRHVSLTAWMILLYISFGR